MNNDLYSLIDVALAWGQNPGPIRQFSPERKNQAGDCS